MFNSLKVLKLGVDLASGGPGVVCRVVEVGDVERAWSDGDLDAAFTELSHRLGCHREHATCVEAPVGIGIPTLGVGYAYLLWLLRRQGA